MQQQIKLISLDLDGTILNHAGNISEATLNTLRECRKRGLVLVFNTARPLSMIPGFLLDYFGDDYWVFSNGTTCMKGGGIIFHENINKKVSEKIIARIHNEYTGYFLSVESAGNIYSTCTCYTTCRKYYATQVSLEELSEKPTNKILVIAEDKSFPVHHFKMNRNGVVQMLVTEFGKYIQFMPWGISKLSAVKRMSESLNIEMNSVLAFGDDMNDIELIEHSGMGVAMGNAVSEVKRKADFVTTSNNNDGVAEFLNEFFLNNSI